MLLGLNGFTYIEKGNKKKGKKTAFIYVARYKFDAPLLVGITWIHARGREKMKKVWNRLPIRPMSINPSRVPLIILEVLIFFFFFPFCWLHLMANDGWILVNWSECQSVELMYKRIRMVKTPRPYYTVEIGVYETLEADVSIKKNTSSIFLVNQH